jgi:hypothetical protein
MAFALLATVPAGVNADPINVSLHGSTAAVHSGGSLDGATVNLGELAVAGGETTATFAFEGLARRDAYNVLLDLSSLTGLESLRFEILDPLDKDDRADVGPYSAYVPTGYSTSNDTDGFSFAQGAGLERSAAFVGGKVAAVADEQTHRGDVLLFSGLNGAEDARVTFGLWDWRGGRSFLVRVTATSLDAAESPEPASMLLLGTGLAGLAAYRRRIRRA